MLKRILYCLVFVAIALIGVGYSASAVNSDDIFISRIMPNDYIELFNAGEDIAIDNLEVKLNHAENLAIVNLENGVFRKNSFIKIKRVNKTASVIGDWDTTFQVNNAFINGDGEAEVSVDDELIETICWGDSHECDDYSKTAPFITAKCLENPLCNDENNLLPHFGGFVKNEIPDPTPEPENPSKLFCNEFEISEIYSNTDNDKKFVEIHNPTKQNLSLNGCVLRTRASQQTTYDFNQMVTANGYLVIYMRDTGLSLAKTDGFICFGEKLAHYEYKCNETVTDMQFDLDAVTDRVQYIGKTNRSYALFDDWALTYNITPGSENIFQEYQTCEIGKTINVATGNCVKEVDVAITECSEDQYRNPATGRCKKLESEKTLQACAANQYRNPVTGRCKKMETETTTATCADGYERNPTTNRCRKKIDSANPDYAVENLAASPESNSLALVALGGIIITLGMIGWSFRTEFIRIFCKIFKK